MKTTIISAIITPFGADESLHAEGLEAHIAEQWDGGISSLLTAGTMGLMQLLSDETYRDLVEQSVRFTAGRGEVLAGVGDTAFARTRNRIRMVEQFDIDGVVVLDPYLIPFNQEELIDYYRALADFSKKPLYLYYLPVRTGIEMTLETVVTLSRHPNIHGIKCSVDFAWTRQLMHLLDPSFRVIVAQPMQLDVLIRGGVSEHLDGIFAVWPQWTVSIAEAVEQGDFELAARRQAVLSEFLRVVSGRYSVFPACAEILKLRGIPGNILPAPMRPLAEPQRQALLEEPVVKQLLHGCVESTT